MSDFFLSCGSFFVGTQRSISERKLAHMQHHKPRDFFACKCVCVVRGFEPMTSGLAKLPYHPTYTSIVTVEDDFILK